MIDRSFSRRERVRPKAASLTAQILVGTCIAVSGATMSAFVFFQESPRWPNGSITMHAQLGSPGGILLDGKTSWNSAVEPALADWNDYLRNVQFTIVRDSLIPIVQGDGRNSIFFADDYFGSQFGDAAGVTVMLSRGGTVTDADVVFNRAYCWNSYRGPIAFVATCFRQSRQDIRRVALHEFGHVLGLDHPNEHGQNVRSIMNQSIDDIESVQPDDANGVAALYNPAGPPPNPSAVNINFPPRNESLDFRNQLELKYRDGLRRSPTATFVDGEGAVVWMQEYLRYRVNVCSHSDATTRVFMQIDGQGIQPVCGSAQSLAFPPRQESLAFGSGLESKYRDTLRRASIGTFVDLEGGAVWTQEYLRLRVSGCNHSNAIQSVFAQIDRGTPVCR